MTAATQQPPRIAEPPESPTSGAAARRREAAGGLLMVSPAVLLLIVFFFIPVILCFTLAFTNARLISPEPAHAVGLDNFVRLVNDPVFWKSLRNTLYFAVVVVPLQSAFVVQLVTVKLLTAPRGPTTPPVTFAAEAVCAPIVSGAVVGIDQLPFASVIARPIGVPSTYTSTVLFAGPVPVTIGSVFGRIAGREAAANARN